MNTLLVLFLICALQSMKCDEELESKVLIRSIPKKLHTPIQKGLKGIDTAENRYFQGLDVIDRKPRVKKVLPAYGLNVFRNKRSVGITVNQTTINVGTINNRRNIKNQKEIAKHVKVEGNDVHRKQKTKSSKTHLKHGKKTIARLRNKTKKKMNKKSHIRTKKRHKSQRITKRHDERKVKNRRLIASRDASTTEYPYVVSIQKSGEHWCAGALLNQRLVITTANCIWKSYRVSKLTIRAGTRHMDRGGQVAKIMEVRKHPFWNIRGGPDNDVGLLLLDRNIKFSHTCHEVDLPNRAMWPAFDDVWVTSWGANRRDGVYDSLASTLQVFHAMLLDHNKCNNMTMRFGVPVTHNFICVTQTGRRAPCTRDTGAPAVSDGVLWGLASWGIRKLCGTERFPAMFSYVASKSNLDFITNATHQLMSDKRFYPYPDRFEVRSGVTKPTTT